MALFSMLEREVSAKSRRHYVALAALMAIMLGGGFQVISILFRPLLWGIWAIVWYLIFRLSRELLISRLLRPIMPLAIWIFAYYLCGIIASPIPVMIDAIKMAFYFVTITTALAIVTSRPVYLTIFANFAQWAVAGNLVITVLLINVPQFQDLFVSADLVHSEGQLTSDRFSGLWGNANEAGLVSLVIVALSAWGKQWPVRMGRFCGILLIYLTVSRTANLLLLAILILYSLIVLSWRMRIRAASLLVIGALVVGLVASMGSAVLNPIADIVDNPEVARILDITESDTREKGYESRLDVLVQWLPVIEAGPWYGYGLNAMSGGGSQGEVFRTDIPYMGIHNLYLGIWLDVGLIGLLSFIFVLAYQVLKTVQLRFLPLTKWGMFSLYLVVLIFSVFNHNMLSSMDGMIAYVLLFLLPACPALASQRIRRGTLPNGRGAQISRVAHSQ